jgi:hypothetical protein
MFALAVARRVLAAVTGIGRELRRWSIGADLRLSFPTVRRVFATGRCREATTSTVSPA